MSAYDQEDLSLTKRAKEVKKAHQTELLQIPNVVGVGVGYRKIGGKPTNQIAVIVMVQRKLPAAQLGKQEFIPSEIEGVPIDVQEVGELRAI